MSNVITASPSVPHPSSASSNRWLWGAIGALGATTLALGVALVQMRTHTPAEAALPTPAVATSPAPGTIATATTGASAADNGLEQKVPPALAKPAQGAHKNIATHKPETPTPVAPAPLPPAPVATQTPPAPPAPAAIVCVQCGTVVAVTPVERDGAASGGGAVAGALIGGLLGNQFGGGTGKTLATVAGAVGGGYAGNTVEKRMKKVTVYLVDVRMDDGSGKRVETHTPVAVGAHVTINNGVLSQ